MQEKIDSFSGEYRFLSNFWPSEVELDSVLFPTVEHAYQAAKTLDKFERLEVLECNTPKHARTKGRKVTVRSDWEDVKIDIMTSLVRQKFTKHEDLKEKLLATKNCELIEENYWGDTFWGVCKEEGKNNLGKILMKIREEISL